MTGSHITVSCLPKSNNLRTAQSRRCPSVGCEKLGKAYKATRKKMIFLSNCFVSVPKNFAGDLLVLRKTFFRGTVSSHNTENLRRGTAKFENDSRKSKSRSLHCIDAVGVTSEVCSQDNQNFAKQRRQKQNYWLEDFVHNKVSHKIQWNLFQSLENERLKTGSSFCT